MEERRLTCTVCPLGCAVTARMAGEEIVELSGHACRRGEAYARAEIMDPRRTLTTTMRVRGANALAPVKSARPLPKHLLMDAMALINAAQAEAPVGIGDVLIRDILGTGVDIVATGRVQGV